MLGRQLIHTGACHQDSHSEKETGWRGVDVGCGETENSALVLSVVLVRSTASPPPAPILPLLRMFIH